MRNDDIYNKNKLQKTRLTGFNKFTFQTNDTFIHCNKIPLKDNKS